MKLIVIYGPPATGKLTVAKGLSKRTGYPIFHNHITVDVVNSLFSSDTNFFWDLSEKMRLLMIEEAAKERIPGLIFTFCYEYKTDDAFMHRLIRVVEKHKGSVHLVHLDCDKEELVSRVKHMSRKKFKKIQTAKKLLAMLKNCEFFKPFPSRKSLEIDNTHLSPQKVVNKIAKHFKLK